ncbi:uncharacterized protein LOC127639058 [Xyrauchen texanus]|uniref:uncharacterized protein LOC127639058 n=1 Tax=Xyrauchen texanus TaxID=154827 RepID=UPI002242C4D9|nr:uncharacterized protein LOC127639058 [Xyrauchen texanus]
MTTKVVLKDSKPIELLTCHCSCVAGLALCNHVADLLYQTSHYSQQGVTAVPLLTAAQGLSYSGTNLAPRSNLYNGACDRTCDLPDMSVLRVNEIYRGMPRETAPPTTTMGIAFIKWFIQRIFRDGRVIKTIKQKVDYFYLPMLLACQFPCKVKLLNRFYLLCASLHASTDTEKLTRETQQVVSEAERDRQSSATCECCEVLGHPL